MMLFKNNAGSILASFLFLAATGNLASFFSDSSASSLLYASANELACTATVSFNTWEDKTIPQKDLPVPNAGVLKYGIPTVLAERFDMNAGEGNWMQSFDFQSFQIEADDPDDASSSRVESVSREVSRSLRGVEAMPSQCYYRRKCREYFMRERKNRWLGRIRLSNQRDIGCNLCQVDDDDAAASAAASLSERLGPEERNLTLDQLKGEVALDNYDYQPSQAEFERDFCNELAFLKDYSSFETVMNCDVQLHCRAATEDEKSDQDNLSITDYRDVQDGDANGLSYVVTSTAEASSEDAM
eukprot:CAMPEP_0172399342 /NCGR_PEP_ID=MMETSP1061-20121228/40536_1 /TAXON_ID=37318 /ORGANISM="Pseudo-nitzschia pungens, Strain cf. pungens" /LENGTH=298 /DNA_ID=CAMNT_0013132201 /DNA_START=123 /DNA_END=1019 /DNA_ORIENTATION=-